ncbi:dual oxidase maturation factor 2-like [Brienomyrus brachyistius]|uniref:dual oxidase maturation factor 2-like n=1 Tax=Brienomyrus brachyistius TaxID=42636 RepID=UPI0020B381F3|nr:dual oxidase maturation factor 2-like [Brienomyrus brachyistius]
MTFYNDIYPFYPEQRTPFIFNLNLLIVILVLSVFAAAFLLILPGIRGKPRLFWMIRIILSLFVGAVIVAVNFSGDWAAGGAKVTTTYKSFSSGVVSADVGLRVGLSGINVTLKGDPVNQLNETIDYNEMFRWTDILDKDYAEALKRGLPNPILHIAEKFTLNSPCGLFYQYRYSGRYTSATMWTAFCCWLIANILLSMPVVLYAGCMMLATGAFIFFSLASFATIQNVPPCIFTVGTVSFQLEFGASFWLSLTIGLLTTFLGVLVVLLDCLAPEALKEAFSMTSGEDDDDEPVLGTAYINHSFLEDVTGASQEQALRQTAKDLTYINMPNL